MISTLSPSISFIIPVRNDAARLARCLESIAASAGRIPVQIIVIDNGSDDDSPDVARKFGATVLSRPGMSVAAMRNEGASTADAEVLGFVDADHEIGPAWVGCALSIVAKPQVGAVGSLCHPPPGGTWVQRTYDLLRPHPDAAREVEWLGSGNLVVSREAFRVVRGFDTSLETCEDVDLCRRLRASGYRIIDEPRMFNVHYGDPAGLRHVYKGELWRGRDNLRVSMRSRTTIREVVGACIPLLYLAAAGALFLSLIPGAPAPIWLPGVASAVLLSLVLLRTVRMLRRAKRLSFVLALQTVAVAVTYDLARALALLARKSYHRASASPSVSAT